MSSISCLPPTRGAGPDPDLVASAIAASLARLRKVTGADLAFSGRVKSMGLVLDRFDGPTVGPLRGVQLDWGRGLGGHVTAQKRAIAVPDYVRAPGITHHYDEIIRAESLRAVAAAPVVVGRQPVAVLYVALRATQRELGRLLDGVAAEARHLEQDIAVADVVRRLNRDDRATDRVQQARVSDAHARLRALAQEIDDPGLRARLLDTADLLTSPPDPDRDALRPGLTGRELDVLAMLAAGLANKEIAERLGIGLFTVKDHLKAIYGKLQAASRLEAVAAGRRWGLTP